MDLTVHH